MDVTRVTQRLIIGRHSNLAVAGWCDWWGRASTDAVRCCTGDRTGERVSGGVECGHGRDSDNVMYFTCIICCVASYEPNLTL